MVHSYLYYVWENVKHRKMRAWLTALGIIIGIAAVVAFISLGQGLQDAINEQFESIGGDKIILVPGSSLMASVSSSIGGIELTEKDLEVIRRVNGVKSVGGYVYKVGKIKFKDETKYSFIIGLPQDESSEIISSVQSFKIGEGRDLKESDKYKIAIGSRLASGDFFKKPVRIRDTLIVEGQDFEVVGIMQPIGNPADDSQVYITLDVAREILNVPSAYGYVMAQVEKGEDIDAVAEKIKEELRRSRHVKEGEEDFSLQTSAQLIESFGMILDIVTAVLIGIAAISLLVGGVGIMNTMYTAVLQRTQEIGVMKAIGAKNSDILSLFLIESGMYGIVGGVMGIAIGMGAAKLVAAIGQQYVGVSLLQASFSLTLIIGALLFSFIVGALSGVAPAYRASKLNPVEALRYE